MVEWDWNRAANDIYIKLCVFVQTHGRARVHTACVCAQGVREVEALGKGSKGEIGQNG